LVKRFSPVALLLAWLLSAPPVQATSRDEARQSLMARLDGILHRNLYVRPGFLCDRRVAIKQEIAGLVERGFARGTPLHWHRRDDMGLVGGLDNGGRSLTVRLREQRHANTVLLRVDEPQGLIRLFHAFHRPARGSRGELLQIVDRHGGAKQDRFQQITGYRVIRLDNTVQMPTIQEIGTGETGLGHLFPSRVGLVLDAISQARSFKHQWSFISGSGWHHVLKVWDPDGNICHTVHGVQHSEPQRHPRNVQRFERWLRKVGSIGGRAPHEP
jgi:hypothetical protein